MEFNPSLNLSNEFASKHLNENVDYNVNFKNLSDLYGPAQKFLEKQRVVKDKSYVSGGFRIPEEHLKKYVSPTEEYQALSNSYKQQSLLNFNQTAKSNKSNRGYNSNAQDFQLGSTNKFEERKITYDPKAVLTDNLIENLEREVERLRKESEEYSNVRGSQFSQKMDNHLIEKNTNTEFVSYNPDRVQVVKHVSTQFKPEYMSLEEVQRLKEEHHKKLLEIENLYYEKKKKSDNSMSRSNKKGDLDLSEFNNLDNRPGFNHSELIRAATDDVRMTKELLNNKNKRQSRASSGQRRRNHSKSDERPLSRDEDQYLRSYMNYQLKKKYTQTDENSEEFWNTTKIKSQNAYGIVNRKDGLPGHIDREDHSLYYMSISTENLNPLSCRNEPNKRSKSRHLNQSYDRILSTKEKSRGGTFSQDGPYVNPQPNSNNQALSAHIAFIKLIYNLIDKQRIGYIVKLDCIKDLCLDEHILNELGFSSNSHFIDCLKDFQTETEGMMTENEFINFLLSQSNLGHLDDQNNDYQDEGDLQNYNSTKQNNYQEENKFTEGNQSRYNNDYDDIPYDGMPMNDNYLSENSKDISSHNKILTNQIQTKINKNPRSKSKEKQIKVSYNDFKDFTNQYKTKADLRITVPKPFSFLNRDDHLKKERKINEMLEERRRKEEEILNYRFKPNELKTHIFVNQLENVIEAEKAQRNVRVEKEKQRILKEMRPFSFYEEDERKFKERINNTGDGPKFLPFKANPIPWTSQVNLYEDLMKKGEEVRKQKVEERARSTLLNAKLPPRMEMHEKKKKEQERNLEMLKQNESKNRSKSFKAKEVPEFSKIHEEMIKNLEKKKAIAKPTEPKPFTFHEPKKNASLREFLDKDNDPSLKNPQIKKNIVDIIKKIQQKPKIEPASTKALDLLMGARRKELEEKQRKEEELMLQDKLREEKQKRLKERVITSKALVDNSKKLGETKKQIQANFRNEQLDKKLKYQTNLELMNQRVSNRPLMFETVGKKKEKLQKGQEMRQEIENAHKENSQLNNNLDEQSQLNYSGVNASNHEKIN